MKRTFLPAFLALSVSALSAQDKGFISGQMSFFSTSVSGVDGGTTSGTFGPVVGYNVSEKITVGLGLNYSNTTVKRNVAPVGELMLEDKTSLFTVEPFMRYMKKVDEDFLLYGQLGVGFGSGKTTEEHVVTNGSGVSTIEETESGLSTFKASIGPGIVFVFAPRWAVNADWGALRYESRTTKPDAPSADDTTTNTFGLALTPGAVTFGLNWLF